MSDTNLYRQPSVGGLMYWSGVFEREPVVLMVMRAAANVWRMNEAETRFNLFRSYPDGSLYLLCAFNGIDGVCQVTGRKMRLLLRPSEPNIIYLSTIDVVVPKVDPAHSTWANFHVADSVAGNWFKDLLERGVREAAATQAVKPTVRAVEPLRDCFAFLGLGQKPTKDEIDSAFRKQLKAAHPDKPENLVSGRAAAETRTRDLVTARDECKRRLGYQ